MMIRKMSVYLLVIYAILTAYLIVRAYLGLPNIDFFTPLLTLVAMTFAVLHASQRIGWRRAVLLLALTFAVSLLFESVGVATGLVYGKYHYSDKLGVKFLNLVPLIIPAAWFMMVYPSYVIATRLVPAQWKTWQWRLGVAALGGVVMTAWDLAMDPLMVSGGHWVWEEPGAYFGVPLQNYWGWWLTVFVTFALFVWLARVSPTQRVREPFSYDRLAVHSYIITGLSSVLLDFKWDLAGPALVGMFALGPWMVMALLSGRQVQALDTIVPAAILTGNPDS